MKFKVTRLGTPLGDLNLIASEKFLEGIIFFEDESYFFGDDYIKDETNEILEKTKLQLDQYFKGKLCDFTIPLNLSGTPFQLMCWEKLTEIPYGETISYKEQAIQVGGPNYSRAVAGANNKNKFPIIIPCHRVIGTNGDLVGYSAGLETKKNILDLENKYKGVIRKKGKKKDAEKRESFSASLHKRERKNF